MTLFVAMCHVRGGFVGREKRFLLLLYESEKKKKETTGKKGCLLRCKNDKVPGELLCKQNRFSSKSQVFLLNSA